MKEIKLNRRKVALVDDEDFEWLNQWKWTIKKCKRNYYAIRVDTKHGRKNISMHRLILGIIGSKLLGDHIDHNGLNNQKYNLRKVTRSENNINKSSKINGTSQYLGVSLMTCYYKDKIYNYWVAQIQKGRKNYRLGQFKNEKDAAIAYNNKAKEIHGEFANLNIIK